VLQELSTLSARLVVMSERGATMLRETYGVPGEKIDLIPHGILDMPFVDSNFYKEQFGMEGKHVLLTFGLLSPNKGIENVLRALPEVIKKFPNLIYIILGATHPNLVREHGEAYRLTLERLAQDLGIKRHVSFYNRFVDQEELKDISGRCRSLHHALPVCGADHFRYTGLRLWQRQGGDFHALLARGGTSRRRSGRAWCPSVIPTP
jgi:glycosyltransferase involved in cell wall biosynthesis